MQDLIRSNPPLSTKPSNFYKNIAVQPKDGYFKYIKFRYKTSGRDRDYNVSYQIGNFAFTCSPLEPKKVVNKLFTSHSDCSMPGLVIRGEYRVVDDEMLYLNMDTKYGSKDMHWRIKQNVLRPGGDEGLYHLLGFDDMKHSDLTFAERDKKKRRGSVSHPTDDELARDWGYDDWESFSACTD